MRSIIRTPANSLNIDLETLSQLPPEGFGCTPTDSEPSGKGKAPSDFNVPGESTIETANLKRSETIDAAYPLSPFLDGVWTYEAMSMTNEDSWSWSPREVRPTTAQNDLFRSDYPQIKKYIEMACLTPSETSSAVARKDLRCVWFQIIRPSL